MGKSSNHIYMVEVAPVIEDLFPTNTCEMQAQAERGVAFAEGGKAASADMGSGEAGGLSEGGCMQDTRGQVLEVASAGPAAVMQRVATLESFSGGSEIEAFVAGLVRNKSVLRFIDTLGKVVRDAFYVAHEVKEKPAGVKFTLYVAGGDYFSISNPTYKVQHWLQR